MSKPNGIYTEKFSLMFTRCVKCNFFYDTVTGDFDSKDEAMEFAEQLHQDYKKCGKRRLIIYVTPYFVEQ